MTRILSLLCCSTLLLTTMPLCTHAQERFILANSNRNGTLTNPAFQGMDSSTSLTAFGRKQWTGINDAPSAFHFTGSTFIGRAGITAGVVAEYKKVAVTSYTSLGAMVSKTVHLTETERLTLGFYGGMDNFSANYSGLGDGDPVIEHKQRVNTWRGVIGAGAMFRSERFYVGVSAPRIALKSYDNEVLRPEDKQRNIYASAGVLLPFSDLLSLVPTLMWNIGPSDKPLDLGATLFIQERVGIGATYRTTGEVNAALQYSFQRSLQLGYTYIFHLGNNPTISRFSGGSHEVFINYRIPWSKDTPLGFKWW